MFGTIQQGVWVPTIRSWALTRGFALHPGTRNRYEIRYTRTQHRPPSRQVNDHGRVSGTHTITLHHFRDRGGVEIDVVAEAADGRLVAVEIKSGPAVNRSDARHLRWLRDKVPDDFDARNRLPPFGGNVLDCSRMTHTCGIITA